MWITHNKGAYNLDKMEEIRIVQTLADHLELRLYAPTDNEVEVRRFYILHIVPVADEQLLNALVDNILRKKEMGFLYVNLEKAIKDTKEQIHYVYSER